MSNKFTERPFCIHGLKVFKGKYIIELMVDGVVIGAGKDKYDVISLARRAAFRMLQGSEVEGAYMRITKIGDASMVDFITRERMKTRVYTGFDKENPSYKKRLEAKSERIRLRTERKCCESAS